MVLLEMSMAVNDGPQKAAIGEVLNRLSYLERGGAGSSQIQADDRIVRELAHNLLTPLSQIEAAVLSVTTSLTSPHADVDKTRNIDSLARINSSVQMAKSFLEAERGSAKKDALGSGAGLKARLRTGAKIYSELHELDVSIPDALPDYNTSFVAGILFPVVQNAMEASDNSSCVAVVYEAFSDSHQFKVCNKTSLTSMSSDIYKPGKTSKEGHDGLGLAGVHRLITSENGSISHQIIDGQVEFIISLPRKGYDG